MLSQELVPGGDFKGPGSGARWVRNLPTAYALGEAPYGEDSQGPEQAGRLGGSRGRAGPGWRLGHPEGVGHLSCLALTCTHRAPTSPSPP